MPAENLTRVEAEERAKLLRVHSYDVHLDLTGDDETFRSTTTVRFAARDGASTFIDAITRDVRSVTLNGSPLDPTEVNDGVRIALPDLNDENELTVVADAAYMNTGEGLHRFVDPVDGEVYVYSQFEVPDSRRVFAVFEQPDLKAVFRFTVTAPASWVVVSNAPVASMDGHGESTTWSFEPTPVISSYITAIVGGPYVAERSELTSSDGRTIPLGVFCRRSLAEHLDADAIFDITRRGFEFYEERFGLPYPFAKYDQIFVPEYNMGAMENAGCVTFTETYVFRSAVTNAVRERRVVTILHELAHMWFGDLVTMRWWNDLWLNESFAEWASTLATAEVTEWQEAWTTFASMEKSWAYRQDQLPSTHPIVAPIKDLDDVQVNFDGITYAKGGSVLKQLSAWVGLDEFLAGVSSYFRQHAWGNTELRDLLVELEASSGRELTAWSKLWLETAGVNTLRPVIEHDADGTITSFAIEQTAPTEHPTLRPHRLAIGCYNLEHDEKAGDGSATGSTLVRSHRVELDVDGARTEVPDLVGRARPDLVLVNDGDLTYAKIRLDDRSWATALEHLAQLPDSLARALIWGAAWDSTRDAEFPASAFVDLVLANIGVETQSTTLRTTLRQLITAAQLYVDPARRPETLTRIGDKLWELAQDAPAGSDVQLQLVTTFASVASQPHHVAALRSLRDGNLRLDGLVIDTDLRWSLLDGLVLNGAAGEEEITAALTDDNTTDGRQRAARARATMPNAGLKRETFERIIADRQAPNAIIRFTASGLVHVTDPALLADLVEPYYAMLTRVWEERSYHIAEELIEGLFPAMLGSIALRDAAQNWLDAHPEAVPALRRFVVEQLAGVKRALSAQQADSA